MEVYLHAHASIAEANRCLATYFAFHNGIRVHQALERMTPDEDDFGTRLLKPAA